MGRLVKQKGLGTSLKLVPSHRFLTKASKFLVSLVKPLSKNEDLSRKESILNIILLGSIVLAFVALIIVFLNQIILADKYNGISFILMLIVLLLFLFLYFLSRKGFIRLAGILLVFLFFIPNLFTILIWGPDLPQGLLTFALIIVLAGIIIGSRFALILTASVGLLEITLILLKDFGIYEANSSWRQVDTATTDVIAGVTTLLLIMLIAWLSNREIERSLRRARASEKQLKKERDLLEVRVKERTKQLEQTQAEKIVQLSRFAEFGKAASSVFHDLVNPLTVLTLHLNHLKKLKPDEIKELRIHLRQAISANERMLEYIETIRRRLQKKEEKSVFSLNKETEDVIKLLEYKAKVKDVEIIFSSNKNVYFFDEPVKFSKVMMNLISNALDSYDQVKEVKKKEVLVKIEEIKNNIEITVTDNGLGIPEKYREEIFKPFFTTKEKEDGMGIGLSIVKDIVESFKGRINFDTSENGTSFKIELKKSS